MEIDILKTMNIEMRNMGINYFYMINDSENITYPYVTGEYFENDYVDENLTTEGEFILDLWTRGSELSLIELKEQIKDKFRNYQRVITGTNGRKLAVCISYARKNPRYTDVEGLKRIEIILQTKYWESE